MGERSSRRAVLRASCELIEPGVEQRAFDDYPVHAFRFRELTREGRRLLVLLRCLHRHDAEVGHVPAEVVALLDRYGQPHRSWDADREPR